MPTKQSIKGQHVPYLVEVSVPPLDETLTYEVNEQDINFFSVGLKVEVPLGSRKATGYCICTPYLQKEKPTYTLKRLILKGNEVQCFNEHSLWLFNWVSQYYGEALSRVIDTAIPPSLLHKKELRFFKVAAASEKTTQKQSEILSLLTSSPEGLTLKEIERVVAPAGNILKTLIKNELVISEKCDAKIPVPRYSAPSWAKTEITLNEHQKKVADEIHTLIRESTPQTVLLHGETGSGKTENYIDAALFASSLGKSALIIVPEIALTPQLIDRFCARISEPVAILHSGLPQRERWNHWLNIISGKVKIILGARSGIFAPVKNLGIIIVDEEHDSSFKQSEGLRYNARDISLVLGKKFSCPVILGSATPSLESFFQSKKNQYLYHTLPSASKEYETLSIEVIDLRKISFKEMPSPLISPQLYQAIQGALQEKNQILILYNRRGFARFFQCVSCGDVLYCPSCSVSLTYHRKTHELVCHYCGYSKRAPSLCSSCYEKDPTKTNFYKEVGAGTEKVVDELKTLFPSSVIDRLDRDAVQSIDEYRDVLARMRDGTTHILVGTQMIAKGHDLPDVTVVGILDGDIGLHMPDFRASERTFQLLTQAAGRAGRSTKKGKVILQTRAPEHFSIIAASKRDYLSFANEELEQREGLSYPPFKKILRVIASGEDSKLTQEALQKTKELLLSLIQKLTLDVSVLGPSSCPIEKIKDNFRFHLLLKAQKPTALIQLINAVKPHTGRLKTKIIFDLDPQEML